MPFEPYKGGIKGVTDSGILVQGSHAQEHKNYKESKRVTHGCSLIGDYVPLDGIYATVPVRQPCQPPLMNVPIRSTSKAFYDGSNLT